MQKERMIKKTITYFIGNLSTKILTVCLVILYAFYIDAGDLGKYEYIQTLVNIIVPIFYFAIWDAILKFILTDKDESKRKKVITTSALFTIFASTIVSIIFGVYYGIFKNNQINTIYIILTYIINGFTWVWQYYAKALDKNSVYIKSSVIGSVVHLITAITLITLTQMKLDALFIANILGLFTTFIVIELNLHVLRNIKKDDFNIEILKRMAKYSLPLVINVIPFWFISGFGKIIVQHILGSEANGVYSFANKFSFIITFFGTIINMAITEEMFILGKDETKNEFSNILQQLIEKFLILTIIALPFIRLFYKFISLTDYYGSMIYVPILLVYAIIMILVDNIAIIFKVYEKTKYQLIATIIGAAATIVFILLTIHTYGIMGVVIGQLLGVITNIIIQFIYSRKYVKIRFNYIRLFIILILYILTSLIMYI